MNRRRFLQAAGTLTVSVWLPGRVHAAGTPHHVVIIGGGWGGLAAAHHLRQLAPALDVTLIERETRFWSMPLSNKWLVGQIDGHLLTHDYAAAARSRGYRFIQAEVSAIDRDRQRVSSSVGHVDYDWLVLSLGIQHDYTAWFGDDREKAELARRQFPAAYTPGTEFATLRSKLQSFAGGDWLMTIPPAPFRCPPAPYERAVLLAGWLERNKVPGRIIIIDPNPAFQEFQRIFRERYPQRILYKSQTPITAVDPVRRSVDTEFEEFSFAEATLMPPQQAGALAHQSGLVKNGWGDVEPLDLSARADPRIFMIGDMVGPVSGLFGHYPKTGQIAVRQGRIVARRIAALSHGKTVPVELPDSLCHITTAYDPPAAIRLAASFRQRGDGELVQQNTVERDPQPRGEDLAWLQSLLGEMITAPQ